MQKVMFDTSDCINLIHKRYPLIPKWVIKRVLYAEEWYMYSIGIITWKPEWKHYRDLIL